MNHGPHQTLHLLSCSIYEPSIKNLRERKKNPKLLMKYFVCFFSFKKPTLKFLFVLLQGCVMFTFEFYMQTITVISNVIYRKK